MGASAAKTDVANRNAIRVRFMEADSMRFSVQEYVRWEDIDAAGIINYQAYLRFFEEEVNFRYEE